jgi:AraC-like DNA-binding protein
MITHGILNPRAGTARFDLQRFAPASTLADLVDWYWSVQWDLGAAPPFVQETLPHPSVHVVVGTHQPGVHGVGTPRFVATLGGRGWVFGIKFRPGGFHPFYGRDLAHLADTVVPLRAIFGPAGAKLERDMERLAGGPTSAAVADQFLSARRGEPDDNVRLVTRIVALIRDDPSLSRSDALAQRAGLSRRSMERPFRRYVGVSPKWVVRRHRIHEACERVAAGAPPSWSVLALDLGYVDQAHFIRDFRRQVGRTPARYAADCANAGARKGRRQQRGVGERRPDRDGIR